MGEGDGEAFRNSGPELDKMKKREQNLVIRTPWSEINEELGIECALLDALIQRWTKEQAEAILYQIGNKIFLDSKLFMENHRGRTQEVIAKILEYKPASIISAFKNRWLLGSSGIFRAF